MIRFRMQWSAFGAEKASYPSVTITKFCFNCVAQTE